MDPLELLALTASLYDEWNHGNLEYVFTLLTPRCYINRQQAQSLAEFRRTLVLLKTACPDLEIIQTASSLQCDLITDHIMAVGTLSGELNGLTPTGEPVAFTATNVWHLREGSIIAVDHCDLDQVLGGLLARLAEAAQW